MPTIGGVSILKPKEFGGVTGYNLNSGDKIWWSPNGGQMRPVTSTDPLFAGVTLPPAPNQGQQAQVMVTKTLTVYGTGRRRWRADAAVREWTRPPEGRWARSRFLPRRPPCR